MLYESIFGDSEFVCEVLPKRIDSQIGKTTGLLTKLEEAKQQGFFVDNELPKMKYLNQNILLYLLVEKSISDCSNKEIVPVLYFYTDKEYSSDEAAQAKVLDLLVKTCSKARVFAFPHDLGIPVVDVIIEKYDISSYPTIIAKNRKYEGLISGSELKEDLGC